MPRTTQILGIVSIVPMGEWEPTITYQKLNYVRHAGANYLAKGSSINVEPGEAENWEASWMLTIYDGSNVTPYGTYPYMTVGAILASELTQGSLNSYLVVDYAGKAYYAAAGNTVTDKPDGVDAFSMAIAMAGDGTAMQVLWETDNNNLYMRDSTQTEWVQFARVDGTYINMTVGKAYADGDGNNIIDTYATIVALRTETAARQDADKTLQTNINAEEAARKQADTALQNNINAEVQARQEADQTLQNNITAETTQRQAADQTLQNNINAANAAIETLDNNAVKKTGETNQIIAGNVQIQGDLTVNGTTYTTNTETLMVNDNLIVANAEGTNLNNLSGLAIRTNSTDAYGILYDPATSSVKLGLGTLSDDNEFTFDAGEGNPIAVRSQDTEWTDGHVVEWNATERKFIDSGIASDDIVTISGSQTISGAKTFSETIQGDISGTAGKVAHKLTITTGDTTVEYDGSSEQSVEIELGDANDPNAVHFTAQVLTEEQQTQARQNIRAASISTSAGGFVGGRNADASSGGAIGDGAGTVGGFAGGYGASSTGGAAIGFNSSASNGGAVGSNAKATTGFAGGLRAEAIADGAVQLGEGTNSTPDTLQFRNYQLCDSNGQIPAARLENAPQLNVSIETSNVVAQGCLENAAISAFIIGDMLVVSFTGTVSTSVSTQPVLSFANTGRTHISSQQTYPGLWVSNSVNNLVPINCTVNQGGQYITTSNLWGYRGYKIGGSIAIALMSASSALSLTLEEINALEPEAKTAITNYIANLRTNKT